jgi:integrase/recombinase XerD
MTLFLTASGEPFSRDHMTSNVKARIDAAKLGKTGACHLFRHTMATLMHENGADIRFIQEILGHVKLETTQIYTHVSIRTLQQVHASTHPAESKAAPSQRSAAEREGLLAALAAEEDDG